MFGTDKMYRSLLLINASTCPDNAGFFHSSQQQLQIVIDDNPVAVAENRSSIRMDSS
jgi:hypothetical protein